MKKPIATISLLLNVILLTGILGFAIKRGYLARLFLMFNENYIELPTDTLSSDSGWQDEVKYQLYLTKSTQIDTCFFGDSITSELGHTMGKDTFNFALPGLTTISQLEQLKQLTAAHVKCNKAIIALGTNDAIYSTIDDRQFINNMQQIIRLIRTKMNAKKVVLIPAFYSSVAASHDITLAGPLERVEQIKALTRQVAATEKVLIVEKELQPLYEGTVLKENVTIDGVHLNAEGRKIYRGALLKILGGDKQVESQPRPGFKPIHLKKDGSPQSLLFRVLTTSQEAVGGLPSLLPHFRW
ncbi:SGNH/GDSL hydrolase family protein [Microcoleus sp. S13_C5]|uniref:SGNH/GDSL hydrolase family protein n=1 Tax=Microcoleus sp. S13_C5 TaxID=3055411 RepID=UPI002FCFF7E1